MKTIYLLSFMLMLSCSKKKEHEGDLVFQKPDQIDYYYLAVSDKDLQAIFQKENMSRYERQLAEILHHDEPTSVTDTTFITEMEVMPYYLKAQVAKNKHDDILKTFSPHDEITSACFASCITLCALTYRDVLVFRNKSKIVGFAKVCFECSQTHFVADHSETVHVDYKSLKKTLEKLPRN